MSNEKKWNPELWKPIGLKPVKIEVETEEPGRKHSFLGYVDLIGIEPYEVRGIMPKAPEEAKRKFKPRPKGYWNNIKRDQDWFLLF